MICRVLPVFIGFILDLQNQEYFAFETLDILQFTPLIFSEDFCKFVRFAFKK